MKIKPSLMAAALTALLAAGCSAGLVGSGHIVSETRQVAGTNAVSLAGVGDLTIVQGEPESLVIEAEDNLLPHIRTRVVNGLLEISEKGSLSPTKPLHFKLTVSTLGKITSSGAGSVQSDKFSSPGLLDLRVEGAGKVKISQLECETLKLVLAGAGDVNLQGHARTQDVEISGAAAYRADDLRTQSTKLVISGAGSAKVWAIGELNVEISGTGNVDYFGTPQIKKQIDGVGSLHALGDKPRD